MANVSILHPLKILENQKFSGVSGGIKWENWSEMGFVVQMENGILGSSILAKIS